MRKRRFVGTMHAVMQRPSMTVRISQGAELLHLVARAADGARPLRTRVACCDLWHRLGARFDVVACVLMPDHVHLLARIDGSVARRAFAQVLSSFRMRAIATREHDCTGFAWEPLPQPQKVQRDPRHLARTVRYIHLNPVRDGLCDDPLEWEWSTHRDWMGAVAYPCVDLVRWGRALRRPAATRAEWLHDYVCSDGSVRRPRALADSRSWLAPERSDASLAVLTAAVPRVLRRRGTAATELDVAGRRLFVLAAGRWTRYSAAELARWIERDPTGVRRLLKAGEVKGGEGVGCESDATKNGCMDSKSALEVESSSAALRENRGRFVISRRRRAGPMSVDELRAMALTLADARLRAEVGSSR